MLPPETHATRATRATTLRLTATAAVAAFSAFGLAAYATKLPASATTALAAGEQKKPNIVFILVDDMGHECVGAYGGTYNTPNTDRLAKDGVRFTYAYSQPLCTPSRVELMTGKYNHKNYVDFGFMNQDQKTFGNLAKMAGYTTCIAGKWQLGNNSKLPAHFGFDYYCLWQLNYPRGQGERYADALLEADGKVVPRNSELYGPDYLENYIEKFIDANKDTGKPFFIYYPMVLVHDPFVSTPLSKDWKTNPKGRHQANNKYFPDMMDYSDRMVGRLVDKLKKDGLYDNTLIIYTGDNGTNTKITSRMQDGTSIRGGKGMTTDAGTHAPLIVTYGSRQGKARVCEDLVDFTDVLPTMAQAMGIPVPKEWDTDGTSFLPQVQGEPGTPRKWVFCHYDKFFRGPNDADPNAKRYIRDHRYKLYSTGEFYDVKADIFEKKPIAPGAGTKEAEAARKFLSAELAKFPPWKVGDILVKPVEYPNLKSVPRKWKKSES